MSQQLKPKLTLYDAVGMGIIIQYPTGVIYCNQVGGSACLQMELEGIYLPVGNDIEVPSKALLSPENELTAYFNSKDPDGASGLLRSEDEKPINTILSKYQCDFIKVDPDRLNLSYEAWIYISITPENNSLMTGFSECLTGILTWNNSD